MDYIAIHVKVDPDFSDILIAELSQVGFDTFEDNNEGFSGFAETNAFDQAATEEILNRYKDFTFIEYNFSTIEKRNWNEEWEQSFEPVIIEDQCIVRATFHIPAKVYPYEIIINPKMSFGTGHHATTSLMLEKQLSLNHQNKTVMDVGSGTGILAIMAEKLGALETFAFDIEEWAVENAIENTTLNNCHNIQVALGTIDLVPDNKEYDIILANINRNVLLNEIPVYTSHLAEKGKLLVSGFYEADAEDIRQCAEAAGLTQMSMAVKDNWVCIQFGKI